MISPWRKQVPPVAVPAPAETRAPQARPNLLKGDAIAAMAKYVEALTGRPVGTLTRRAWADLLPALADGRQMWVTVELSPTGIAGLRELADRLERVPDPPAFQPFVARITDPKDTTS